jgi:hypothetical protein
MSSCRRHTHFIVTIIYVLYSGTGGCRRGEPTTPPSRSWRESEATAGDYINDAMGCRRPGETRSKSCAGLRSSSQGLYPLVQKMPTRFSSLRRSLNPVNRSDLLPGRSWAARLFQSACWSMNWRRCCRACGWSLGKRGKQSTAPSGIYCIAVQAVAGDANRRRNGELFQPRSTCLQT